MNYFFVISIRSHSSKVNKTKKFKQETISYPNSNYLQLTDELLDHYMKAKQLETTYTLKWKLCQDLFSMFVGIVPSKIKSFKIFYFYLFILDLGVYLVGSSANGFATEDTDADICIVISSYPIDQKREAVKFLEIIRRALRKKICSYFLLSILFHLDGFFIILVAGGCDLIRARVPILRFTDYAT